MATAAEVTEVTVEASDSDGACVSCVEDGVKEGESEEELELERLCCCE